MLEAIKLCEEITGKKLKWKYVDKNRIGDHIWWISSVEKFKKHYPQWKYKYNLKDIFAQIFEELKKRL